MLFFGKTGSILADFLDWRKSATPFFADWRTSLIYKKPSANIIISKGSEYKPIYSAVKKERNEYETQKP